MTEAAAAKPAKAKKPAKKAEHPPSGVMVLAAVKALKDKKGSSLPAIKKYIAANYKVKDSDFKHWIDNFKPLLFEYLQIIFISTFFISKFI